jgi:RNA polymerase sigma factor (sigma-70 family)
MENEIETDVRDRIEVAYEEYYPLLRFIAGRRFKIPAADIRPLIHDVFVSFMRHEQAVIDDRRWLTTAVSNACRNYWRNFRLDLPLPEDLLDSRNFVDDALAKHDVALLLAHLSEKCRAILRLRYAEGLSPGEIAARLGTSAGYVRLKVHRCLEAARRTLKGLP